MPPVVIRTALAADRERLAISLADAFFDEPSAIWATPSPRHRRTVLLRYFREQLRQQERRGLVHCDDDCRGAAIWMRPGHTQLTLAQGLAMLVRAFHHSMILRFPLVTWGDLLFEHRQPQDRELFYLADLGVSPGAQGKGLGDRLLEPALEQCDASGTAAWLEASRPERVGFYERHGFRVVGEQRLPFGPTMPLMLREPA